jgi:hypothetical protein
MNSQSICIFNNDELLGRFYLNKSHDTLLCESDHQALREICNTVNAEGQVRIIVVARDEDTSTYYNTPVPISDEGFESALRECLIGKGYDARLISDHYDERIESLLEQSGTSVALGRYVARKNTLSRLEKSLLHKTLQDQSLK